MVAGKGSAKKVLDADQTEAKIGLLLKSGEESRLVRRLEIVEVISPRTHPSHACHEFLVIAFGMPCAFHMKGLEASCVCQFGIFMLLTNSIPA